LTISASSTAPAACRTDANDLGERSFFCFTLEGETIFDELFGVVFRRHAHGRYRDAGSILDSILDVSVDA